MPSNTPSDESLGVNVQQTRRPRGWTASLLFATIGLAISVYLTIEHYSASTTLVCPESATINCAKVTTSTYARFLGIPVAVLGLAFFLAMVVLCAPRAWRYPRLNPLRIAGGSLGVLGALYLIWAELFKIDAICLWCTGVHVCTLGLLGSVLYSTDQ